MKAIAINGSPRKNWNTDMLLQQALNGAADAGAETEMIQLSELTFSGCRSCFACKINGAETGRCMWKDDLQPVFDKILSADAVFMGSPIYLGNVSGMMYCLMERLVFSLLSYDDYSKKLFHGNISSCFFFTMNAPKVFAKTAYRGMMKQYVGAMERLGSSEYYAACDTLQFDDYSRYAAGSFNEAHKHKMREEQFPKDLKTAYDIGFRLISSRVQQTDNSV
ncbi:MAG: flavodoxin family protein [Oscillospiraceae bacterium]|nr:flavodoxin family protein [Oscillospiraceae bacterium]